MRRYLFFLSLFAFLLVAHLLHSRVLWAEETLPLAAALQMKHGAVLYRDIWFDKPPLVPAIYLLWGAMDGVVLRVAGALFDLAACVFAYAAGVRMWSRREGYVAASLLAFFLTFDTHSAVLPLAADLLLLVPHLAAMYFAWSKRAFLCGAAAGVGFLVNAKALFVLVACGLFLLSVSELALLAAGFALINAVALAWLAGAGALDAYLDQVWRWPALYAASPIVANPVWNGIVRTGNWLGFHAALLCGAGAYLCRDRRWKLLAWVIIAYAGVALGWRFFPRYFFLLLPALTMVAARGIVAARKRWLLALMSVALILPVVRFAPHYFSLEGWGDLALDRDSREASKLIASVSKDSSTLFVWGYRPELFIYTGLKPATKYLESQAMTGVPADRHLGQSTVVLTSGTHEARVALAAARPDVIADGLSPYNPSLAMNRYEELRPLLADYREAGRTKGTIVYVRR